MAPKEAEDDDWSTVDEDGGVIGMDDEEEDNDVAGGVGEVEADDDSEGKNEADDDDAIRGTTEATAGLKVAEADANAEGEDEHASGGDDDDDGDGGAGGGAAAEAAAELVQEEQDSTADGAGDEEPTTTDGNPDDQSPAAAAVKEEEGIVPDESCCEMEAKFFEGDRAMLVASPAEPTKVRIIRVASPQYVIALPDGTELPIPFTAASNGALLTLDEYESLQSQKDAENLGVITTEWYGGDGGGPFDDLMPDVSAGGNETRRIVEIGVRAGAIVDAVRVTYSDGTAVHHGGDGGDDGTGPLSLGGGEYINEVVVRYGRYVQSLTFVTNLGRKLGPRGGRGAPFLGLTAKTVRVKAPTPAAADGSHHRYMLAALHGRSGKFLDGIGFHWAPVTSHTEGMTVPKHELETRLKRQRLKSSDCYGGDCGGEEFDDGHYNIRITDITVRTGGSKGLVKGIEVRYYNGRVGSYGGGGGGKLLPGGGRKGEEYSLSLQKGEYVTKAIVGYGEFVRGLAFITNTGRQLGPCGEVDGLGGGGGGGDDWEEDGGGSGCDVQDAVVQAPDGYMFVGIKGRSSGSMLDSIGFNFSPAPTE